MGVAPACATLPPAVPLPRMRSLANPVLRPLADPPSCAPSPLAGAVLLVAAFRRCESLRSTVLDELFSQVVPHLGSGKVLPRVVAVSDNGRVAVQTLTALVVQMVQVRPLGRGARPPGRRSLPWRRAALLAGGLSLLAACSSSSHQQQQSGIMGVAGGDKLPFAFPCCRRCASSCPR